MNRRDALFALGALAAWPSEAATASLPPAKDLRADGERARIARVPIVVLFSLPGCPFCEQVRRSHLVPITRDPARAARAIIRQVDVNSSAAAVGFRGESTTHARIADEHGVKMAPVVQFWSARGEALTEPLVGMLLPDFYEAYLEAALESASKAILARS